MPPLTRNNKNRHLEVMLARPAARAHAVATGQQIGTAGTIPGVTSYTVTTTAGSTGVTGTGLSAVIVGGLYAIAGVTGAFTVASVDSSTHVTMTRQIPTAVSGATMIQAPQQPATVTGTVQQYPAATALAASASAGDSSISVNQSIAAGSYVVIDQNTATTTQESNLTTGVSGSGPYTLTLTSPLGYPHAASAQVMGPTTSPNGDQIAGVGHAVLNNAGNPVVVMGNLNAVSGGASSKLPSSFQDGGFAFVDADGNMPAGYSQATGLWGFGSLAVNGYTNVKTLDFTGDVSVSGSDGAVTVDVPLDAYIAGAFLGPMVDPDGGYTTPGDHLSLVTATTNSQTTWPNGNPYYVACAERSLVYSQHGESGGLLAGCLVSFALIAVPDNEPDLVSITVNAVTMDGANGLNGHWDNLNHNAGSVTWESADTNFVYSLGFGPADQNGSQGDWDYLDLGISLSENTSLVWGGGSWGSDIAFSDSGNATGEIVVSNDISVPLVVNLRCTGYWLA